jgi:DNA-directed RNA polymerase specialized sigma subunit
MERLADPEPDVHDSVVVRIEVARVRRYLHRLPALERRIITLLYGVGDETISRRQAATRFGLSRRALARVEDCALDRLRSMYERDAA